jgi:5-methylcytosine-specific restriction endonuclease McrA
MNPYDLSHVPDEPLLRNLDAITASVDRQPAAVLLAHIGEVEARHLHLPAGYDSMFAYCVGKLRMSEDIAYKRIWVARKARRFPAIFLAIADGRVHLSGMYMLIRHFSARNVEGLIAAATHKRKREIQLLIAHRFPQAEVPATIRALPSPAVHVLQQLREEPSANTLDAPPACSTSCGQLAPGQVVPATPTRNDTCLQPTPAPLLARGRVTPLAPKVFSVQFSIPESAEDDLRAIQGLLAHQIPDRNIGKVSAVAYKIARGVLEKRKFAATDRPARARQRRKQRSRHVPAHVRRAVWKRDGGRCTFVSKDGTRCDERGGLEFDHVNEFARGGQATIEGMRLLCRAHNQYAAECTYGAQFMREKREAGAHRADAP